MKKYDENKEKKQYVSFITNYIDKDCKSFKPVTLDELVDTFNIKDDNAFLAKLGEYGYNSRLTHLNQWAHKAMRNKDWKAFTSFPFLMTLHLRDVYSGLVPNFYNLIDLSESPRERLVREDFTGIDEMPDHIFNVIADRFKKGIYALKKELFPAVIFAAYNPDRTGKYVENITTHAGYFGIDIDIAMDNPDEVLNVISKHFNIAAVLYSPSQTIRPVIKLKIDNDKLKELAEWKGNSLTNAEVKKQNHVLLKEYQKVVFNMVSSVLAKEKIMSNGELKNLVIDTACKNANRLWYVARGGRDCYIVPNAQPYDLSKEDYLLYRDQKPDKRARTTVGLKKLRTSFNEDLSITTSALQPFQLDYINTEIISTVDEIVSMCEAHNHQPLFNGSNMYPNCLKLLSSIKNVASIETIEYVFTELFNLSKLDERVMNIDYAQRDYSNYIVPTFQNLKHDDTIYFQYVYGWRNEIKSLLGIKPEQKPIHFLDDKDRVVIDAFELDCYLRKHYFRLKEKKALFIKNHHLVKEVYNGDQKEEYLFYNHLLELLKSDFDSLSDKELYNLNQAVQKDIMRNKLLVTVGFNVIDPEKFIERDKKDTIFIYTAEKLLEIKKDNITPRDYTEEDVVLESYLSKDHLGNPIHFDDSINYLNYKSLPFYEKMAGDDEAFLYAKCIIGYLISTYRSANENKVVVLFDGLDDNDNGGGTGKSLVMRVVEHVRNILKIVDPHEGRFIYDGLENQTNVMLDDVSWISFSIKNIKPFTELCVTKQVKYQNTSYTTAHNTPRLCISSNFYPNLEHESYFSRCVFFNPTTFFKRGVRDGYTWLAELHAIPSGKYKIMEYETEEEWSHFMAFVVHCCQCFLEHGVERFNSDLMIRMKGVNNKKSDLQYVLLEKVVRDYVAESAGIRIAIKSSDLQIHWSVELKKAGLPPRRRFVNNDQEFVRQIQLDDHSIQYYNKDAECPYGWGFIGFVMTPKSGNGITKTVHDIFGLN